MSLRGTQCNRTGDFVAVGTFDDIGLKPPTSRPTWPCAKATPKRPWSPASQPNFRPSVWIKSPVPWAPDDETIGTGLGALRIQ